MSNANIRIQYYINTNDQLVWGTLRGLNHTNHTPQVDRHLELVWLGSNRLEV
jgi:hypothetical protein